MNIALPEKFFYSAGDRDKAFVDNNILYIEGRINFEDLMYSITYSLKGYHQCLYCGRELASNKRTLDHMYPKHFGGVSIPDNLIPCCQSCNSTKSCLTTEQFYHWRRIKQKDRRERAFNGMVAENRRKFKNGIILPKEWISYYNISEVINQISFEEVIKSELANSKIELFYFKYHHYHKPIIVSSNNWVFAGFHILYHAKKHSIENVPAIILDNVVHLSH